jgi:ELWxxDGT repeat protein
MYADIGIWNDPANGSARAYSGLPRSSVGNSAIAGFGIFAGTPRYILRETTGLGRVFWTDARNSTALPVQIGALADQTWQIGAVADMDKDGVADIVWRNSGGANAIWLLTASGNLKSPSFAIDPLVDSNWEIKGAADFNGDGNTDILWYHKTNGLVVAWYLNATYQQITAAQVLTTLPNASWEIRPDAAGDFDGDGDGDFLATNKSNNTAVIYKMQGGVVQPPLTLAGQPNIPASLPPARNYAPLVMLDAPINTLDITSSGGSNPLAMGDLGVLNSNSRITLPSRNNVGSSAFDTRYKFQVAAGSTATLAIGVDNPWFTVINTAQDGTGIGGFSERGGFMVQSYGPGTHYLRVNFNPNAPAGTNADANYNLIVNPAVAPPVLAADITPGTASSVLANNVTIGTTNYFLIAQGDNSGLWKTDGTIAGTSLVKAGFSNGSMIANGSTLYFAFTDDSLKGMELWKSDGTAAGTVQVKDINPDTPDSYPTDFTIFNGQVYFAATDSTNGRELWKTDGTASGTVLVANIGTDTATDIVDGSPAGLTVFNGSLVFSANNGTGRELWRVSTGGVPTVITNFPASANPQFITNTTTHIYASVATGGQDANKNDLDTELVRVDTSWNATKLDVSTGASSSTPEYLTAWGGDLYFTAKTAASGRELYRANGSGFVQIADINPGAASAAPSSLTVANSKLMFAATEPTNGRELWAYNGSVAPTRISQIASGASSSYPRNLSAIGNTVYFTALNSGYNFELYKTDGTTVSLVKEINTGNSNADPSKPGIVYDAGNGKGIFNAFTNDFGYEPWITDGTSGGTFQLVDATISPRGEIGQAVTMGGWSYFAAQRADVGTELFRTDGTTTQLVSDINAGWGSSKPDNLTVAGGFVYFSAYTKTNGVKLWRTDGVTTAIVGNINAATESDYINSIAADTSGNVFVAGKLTNTAGTLRRVVGTNLVEIKNFGIGGGIDRMTALGNAVYMGAVDASTGVADIGIEPWVATTAGASLLGDIQPGSGGSVPRDFVRTDNGDVYFVGFTTLKGDELYKSAGGTGAPVQFIRPATGGLATGANGANIGNVTALGNEVFFRAVTSVSRRCPRANYTNLTSCGSWNVPADNTNSSINIWRTDGTDNGTFIDPNLNAESLNYGPISDNTFIDFTSLMAVSSPAGKSIYVPSVFGRRDPDHIVNYIPNGLCGVMGASSGLSWEANIQPSREVRVSFPMSQGKHGEASRVLWAGNQTSFAPNGGYYLALDESAISVEAPYSCTTDFTPFGQPTEYSIYRQRLYDTRLANYEDIVLGNMNGTIYIAGWKVNRYEVWAMPHSESLATRYSADGGVAPRNLTFVGSLANVRRKTLEFMPANNQMLFKGFDSAAKKYKVWKI